MTVVYVVLQKDNHVGRQLDTLKNTFVIVVDILHNMTCSACGHKISRKEAQALSTQEKRLKGLVDDITERDTKPTAEEAQKAEQ